MRSDIFKWRQRINNIIFLRILYHYIKWRYHVYHEHHEFILHLRIFLPCKFLFAPKRILGIWCEASLRCVPLHFMLNNFNWHADVIPCQRYDDDTRVRYSKQTWRGERGKRSIIEMLILIFICLPRGDVKCVEIWGRKEKNKRLVKGAEGVA